MKVAIVYHLDPSFDGKGGAVRYVNNLLRSLLNENIDTTLIGAEMTEQTFTSKNYTFVPIIKNSTAWWKYLLFLFLKLPSLKLPKDTIIHVHRIEYALPFLVFRCDNPLIYTIHGERLATAKSSYSPYVSFLLNLIYTAYEKILFKNVDRILSVSKSAAKSFEKIHPSISDKIKVIPVGVNLSEFENENKQNERFKHGFDDNDFLILYAGLLEKRKNLSLLLNSFSRLKDEIDNAKLIIVGDGPQKELLQNIAADKKITKSVFFYGEVNRDLLVSLFICADIYAHTSFSEGSPNVFKEALASGTAIVSTNVGDAKEVINNKYIGKVTESFDETEFSRALLDVIRMINSEGNLVSFHCKKAAQKYSFEETIKEIIQAYSVVDYQ